jgi:hypothetical protein
MRNNAMIIYPKRCTQMGYIVLLVILYHPIKLPTIDIETHCLIIDAKYVARSSTSSLIPFGVEVAIRA